MSILARHMFGDLIIIIFLIIIIIMTYPKADDK